MKGNAPNKLIEAIADNFPGTNHLIKAFGEDHYQEHVQRYAYRKFSDSRESFLGRFDSFFIYCCFEADKMSQGGEMLIQPFLRGVPTPKNLFIGSDVDDPEKITILVENSKSSRTNVDQRKNHFESIDERQVNHFLLDVAMEGKKLVTMSSDQVENNFSHSYLFAIGLTFEENLGSEIS